MGTYCTTTSLQTLLVGYSFSGASSSLATLTIEMAEAKINSFMSKRYDVDVLLAMTGTSLDAPPLLKNTCRQLASGYFLEFQSRGGKESRERGATMVENALECLAPVSEGDADLLDSTGNVIADKDKTNMRVLSNTADYSSTFNEDPPTSWKIDDDKLDAIESERDS